MNICSSIFDIKQNPWATPTKLKAAEGNICILAHVLEGPDLHPGPPPSWGEIVHGLAHTVVPPPFGSQLCPCGAVHLQGTALQRNTLSVS